MLHARREVPRTGVSQVEIGGVIPPNQVDICSGASSERGLSLLTSLLIRRRAPLIARLDWRGGLFLDSASALFLGW